MPYGVIGDEARRSRETTRRPFAAAGAAPGDRRGDRAPAMDDRGIMHPGQHLRRPGDPWRPDELELALSVARWIGSPYWVRSAAGWLASALIRAGALPPPQPSSGENLTEVTPMDTHCRTAALVRRGRVGAGRRGADRLWSQIDRLVDAAPGLLYAADRAPGDAARSGVDGSLGEQKRPWRPTAAREDAIWTAPGPCSGASRSRSAGLYRAQRSPDDGNPRLVRAPEPDRGTRRRSSRTMRCGNSFSSACGGSQLLLLHPSRNCRLENGSVDQARAPGRRAAHRRTDEPGDRRRLFLERMDYRHPRSQHSGQARAVIADADRRLGREPRLGLTVWRDLAAPEHPTA